LKVSILVFGLEVNPRNLCVTGTFTHTAHPDRVAPDLMRHGDG
jgi:hypothetical protein